MRNLISSNDLSQVEIEEILKLAKEIETDPKKFRFNLKDKSLAIAFFEPSTRIKVGFSLAMQKLGGQVVEISEQKYKEGMSSPESLGDTLRVLGDYTDCIIMRHYSEDFIKQIDIPAVIINCGNGSDEHPTQALIDLYSIWREYGKIDGLSISIVGNLKDMRASHSFLLALSKFDNVSINLVSPKLLKMPEKYKKGLLINESSSFEIGNEDVVYMTGFTPNQEVSDLERLQYQMNEKRLRQLKDKSIILCPLPRVDEITKEVDQDRRARYFEQSKSGLYVRMAVLSLLLKD